MHLIFTFTVLCMRKGLFKDNPSISDAIFFVKEYWKHMYKKEQRKTS